MWNPYVVAKPVGLLRGHTAPIVYLAVVEEDNRIFSISTDKCIRVWDCRDQSCLLTVRPKTHKIRGEIQACHYCNLTKTIAIATEQMNGLSIRLK
jgi:WD40 repeat protein